MNSPKFQFNVQDLLDVLKNAFLVALAAFLTFIVQNLSSIEMGQGLLIMVPMITIALNSLINWIKDNQKSEESDTKEPEQSE